MANFLCCRTRSAASAESQVISEQVVNLLTIYEEESQDENEERTEEEDGTDASNLEQSELSRRKDTKALLTKMDEKEKGLMERITTAEAIVAKELERIQNLAAENHETESDEPLEEHRKIDAREIHRNTSSGGEGGESNANSGPADGLPTPSAAAAAAAEDQISIDPRAEITEKDQELVFAAKSSGAEHAATDLPIVDAASTLESFDETTNRLTPTPPDVLLNKQRSGSNRQDVPANEHEISEKSLMEPIECQAKEANQRDEKAPGDSPTSHGDLIDVWDKEMRHEDYVGVKREFSASLGSLTSEESSSTLTTCDSMAQQHAFADSMTELKPVTSDLDVRYATSSSEYSDPTQLSTAPNATLEDLGITADDSAQQLSDYFKLREQTSNFSSSSDGSFIMAEEGRLHIHMDAPEIVFPCLKEKPTLRDDELAEATPIVVESHIVHVIDEILTGAAEIVDRKGEFDKGKESNQREHID